VTRYDLGELVRIARNGNAGQGAGNVVLSTDHVPGRHQVCGHITGNLAQRIRRSLCGSDREIIGDLISYAEDGKALAAIAGKSGRA
jgi:hypothetical protein